MNSKKEQIKIFYMLGGIMLIGLLAMLYDSYFKSLPQDYTVGTIDKIWKPLKGGIQASYVYSINGEEYDGNVSNSGYEEIAKPGRKFIVEYPKANASRGVMLLDKPVPDSITPPEQGWDELPEFAQ